MTRNQEIRKEVLFQLCAQPQVALSVALVARRCKHEGLDFTETEIGDAFFFLKGQGLCSRVVDPASGDVRHQVTSAGILHFEGSV